MPEVTQEAGSRPGTVHWGGAESWEWEVRAHSRGADPEARASSLSLLTFLPRSKRLLISWLQSPSAVILEPRKIKSCSNSFWLVLWLLFSTGTLGLENALLGV